MRPAESYRAARKKIAKTKKIKWYLIMPQPIVHFGNKVKIGNFKVVLDW